MMLGTEVTPCGSGPLPIRPLRSERTPADLARSLRRGMTRLGIRHTERVARRWWPHSPLST
jgi:hypothetical protein